MELLFMMGKISVHGGKGGKKGENGKGGAGGHGGRGGSSFSWTESTTIRNSDGTSRT
jgi:hypothetical protein